MINLVEHKEIHVNKRSITLTWNVQDVGKLRRWYNTLQKGANRTIETWDISYIIFKIYIPVTFR